MQSAIAALRGKDVVFIPLLGNAGDSFIVHATYQEMDRAGIRYTTGIEHGTYPGQDIVLSGGGNLVAPYENGVAFLRRNMGLWRSLVILPHTIRSYEDVFSKMGSECTIFCREKPSFEFLKSCTTSAQIEMAHDMAFSCDFDKTFRDIRIKNYSNTKLAIRDAKRLLRSLNYLRKERKTLNVMRTDVEKTNRELPSANIDLSAAFMADDMLAISSLHTTYCMVKFIKLFEVVKTNRLHVGIMSAMLGKNVIFYDNNYGKNKSVYEFSMIKKFNNIRLIENLE